MTEEELIKKAAEWWYLNLINFPEEERRWWINEFIDYMLNI